MYTEGGDKFNPASQAASTKVKASAPDRRSKRWLPANP